MDPVTILVVSLIVAAFIVFAGVLAYGEHVTRRTRPARELAARQAAAAKAPIKPELRKVG